MMKIPTTLKHKPVIVVENYSQVDGYLAGDTDAQGLSLGLAQWNDRGRVEISAKVWRHTGEKWSRQSEELPIHRVLDLCILFCQAKGYFAEAYRQPKLYDPGQPRIGRIGLQGDAMSVDICTDNPELDGDIALFYQALTAQDDEFLSARLHLLANMLREMGYGWNSQEKKN